MTQITLEQEEKRFQQFIDIASSFYICKITRRKEEIKRGEMNEKACVAPAFEELRILKNHVWDIYWRRAQS